MRKIAVVLLGLALAAAPVPALAGEGCFGQDSSGGGRVKAPEGQYSAAAAAMFKPLGRAQTLSLPSPNPCYTPRCYRELNGRGEIIKWVKNENQCRHSSNGRSWGYPGNAKNIYRDIPPK